MHTGDLVLMSFVQDLTDDGMASFFGLDYDYAVETRRLCDHVIVGSDI